MSIRQRLLWLGLATLALPWAGCQYAREMEFSLRAAEQQGLLAVAQSIATSLQGRSELCQQGGLRWRCVLAKAQDFCNF